MPTTHPADMLAGLNTAQSEAVHHFEGPILVLAGAGSGKTRVLTTRIARLVEHHGVDPRTVLAVTFTNKAAGEMRDRIGRHLGEQPTGMWTGTFHAIGARMVRQHAARLGRTANFTIYDEDDTLGVVKRAMERLRISTKQWTPKAISAAISDAKNAMVMPEEYARLAMDTFGKAVAPVYAEVNAALRAANAVSFDDLLVLPVQLLRDNDDVRAQYRRRFQFILVDEYQDTNHAQYQLVKLLGGERGNVMVVGDDDQSIYGWRGADIRNILDFEKDFPNARIVRLEENYRSTPPILELANVVIKENVGRRGKTLRATRTGGDPVTLIGALDERDEAEYVLQEIIGQKQKGAALSEFAVLYRTNSQSRALEESMRRHALPYKLVGAVRFYDRREIRDVMAYLKLVANPSDDEAFRRAIAVPRRGIGDATVEMLAEGARAAGVAILAACTREDLLAGARPAQRVALTDFAALIARLRERAQTSAVDEVIREMLEQTGYLDVLRAEGPEGLERMENVRELITGAAETVVDEGGEVGLTPLDHFLQRATLVAAVDGMTDGEAVTLMTMHNAKGLEFPTVFITGLEDGLFPLARAFDEPAMLEEERRLFYVGITRAERKLYLLHARMRRRNGETMACIPSSFLRTVPKGMLEERSTIPLRATGKSVLPQPAAMRRPGSPMTRPAKRDPDADIEVSQDAPRFALGERVKHARFGSGIIAELSGNGRDAKVTVDFDDEMVGRKRLVIAYAGLERGWD